MICSADVIHELIQQIQNSNDETAVRQLCNCFSPEIKSQAKKVDLNNRYIVEQEIRDEFILRVRKYKVH